MYTYIFLVPLLKLVSLDRIYILCQSKDLEEKLNCIGHSTYVNVHKRMKDKKRKPLEPNSFLKFKLLTAYNVMHKFHIIFCISESYLNSDTSSSDENLNIPGYNMSRIDYHLL